MKYWVSIVTLLVMRSLHLGAADLPIVSLELKPSVFSDKLTQHSVRQTFQDSRGALWLVTQEGLNKYTGHELENYQHSPSDPNSLTTNNITRIAEDYSGRLWLSTRGAGLVLYNPISNGFESIYSDPNNHNTPYSNNIITIFSDSSGALWLGYLNGFSKFEPNARTFHHYVAGSNDIPITGEIGGFTQTPDGLIWAATQTAGLLRIDPATGETQARVHDPAKEDSIVEGWLYNLLTDRNGDIWIASAESGVSKYDPIKNTSVNYRHHPEKLDSLSSNRISETYQDKTGDIWIATREGLNLYLPETESFVRYTDQNTSMQEDLVVSIFQSNEGKYWVGTMSGLASGMKTDFQKFDRTRGNLSHDSVNAFAETENGSLWVGTDDGLNRLSPGSSEFQWVNESTKPTISDSRVMSLLADTDTLWVGTYEGGLNRLDLNSSEVTAFRHSPLEEDSIGANGITSMAKLSTGELLIGTYGGGLSIFIPESDHFKNLTHNPADRTSISNNMVLAIFEDSVGEVWVGTERGLNKFDVETESFESYFANPKDSNSLSSDMPWCFFEDSEGTLWIGTAGGGLNLWRIEDRIKSELRIKHFSDKISLPSSSIYGIQGDNLGWVWISHNKGLTRIHPKTLETQHYGIRDGLQDTEFTLGASLKSPAGTLYFGGIRGFNTIHPETLQVDRTPPQIAISQIKIMDERREFEQPYQTLEAIELGYEDRMLSIEFYAADYANPELINYAHKLEGLSPDWKISKGARIASFTTLPPGSYQLKLAAASPNGTWNWDGRNIPIHVAPPWWRSTIAYSFYILSAAAIIFLFFYRQAQQARLALERQRELEQRVDERTIDLSEARKIAEEATRAKSDFLATMSHEIRTPMHGIIGMTELLLHTSLNEQQQQFASAAHNSGESLLSLINEILDFSKVEASKVELEEVEFSLTELLDDICYLQAEPANKRGLTLNNICDPNIPDVVTGDPTKIRQVIMNLVSNSIKFTHQGNVNVRVSSKINSSNPALCLAHITVEDDGIGMDEETQVRVFEPFTQADTSTTREYGGTGLGLSISRHYIDLMGGDIVVQSAVGHGTKITMSIPLTTIKECTNQSQTLVGYHSKIFTTNPATYEMIASHLQRIGVGSSPLLERELESSSSFENTILIVDYNPTFLIQDILDSLSHMSTVVSVMLIPLTPLKIERIPPSWTQLTKPITSKNLTNILADHVGLLAGSSQRELEGQENSSASKQVLVAEDVPTNQKIIQEMIQLLGHHVEIAENGEIAVAKFRKGNFDTIFMDCQMPIMDGYQATEEIRSIERENEIQPTHIIALTAGTSKEDQEKCMDAGMTGFLTKPFTIQDIENNLGRAIPKKPSETLPLRLDLIDEFKEEYPIVSDTEPEPTSSSEILNYSAIESIRDVERQTGKPILPSIFEGFTEQMSEKLEEIVLNVQSEDGTSIYRTAHAIKSMSANIGAKRVTSISAQMEIEGRDNALEGMEAHVSNLKGAYIEFLSEFEMEITD